MLRHPVPLGSQSRCQYESQLSFSGFHSLVAKPHLLAPVPMPKCTAKLKKLSSSGQVEQLGQPGLKGFPNTAGVRHSRRMNVGTNVVRR